MFLLFDEINYVLVNSIGIDVYNIAFGAAALWLFEKYDQKNDAYETNRWRYIQSPSPIIKHLCYLSTDDVAQTAADGYCQVENRQYARAYLAHKQVTDNSRCQARVRGLANSYKSTN